MVRLAASEQIPLIPGAPGPSGTCWYRLRVPRPPETTPPAAAVEAGRRLEEEAPGYLASVRREVGRFAARAATGEDLETAVDAVGSLARIDTDVPTESDRRLVSMVKAVIKRGLGWYFGYLGSQISALGLAVARLGELLAGRTEQLEGSVSRLQADTEELRARVEALEATPRPPA